MFNTTNYVQRNSNVEVTVNRAPTDESVRLLREMESAAKQQVEKSITLANNDLQGVAHSMRDPLSCGTKVALVFKLNGKQHRVDVFLDDFKHSNTEQKVTKMVESVSAYLAGSILQSIITPEFIRGIS